VSDCSRPKEKLKKFHILILVASKPSLNPFIVKFLCQSAHPIFVNFQHRIRLQAQARDYVIRSRPTVWADSF